MEKKNRTATDKIKRVLDIYTRLTNGDIIDKSALAVEYTAVSGPETDGRCFSVCCV